MDGEFNQNTLYTCMKFAEIKDFLNLQNNIKSIQSAKLHAQHCEAYLQLQHSG